MEIYWTSITTLLSTNRHKLIPKVLGVRFQVGRLPGLAVALLRPRRLAALLVAMFDERSS